ncbi:MAG TPA: maleylpyruvate isomerase N-terminal domain-containing protein [Candidatus Krumholzibacteria bacterium]
MTSRHETPALPGPAAGNPYAAEIEAERHGWYELAGLVRGLTPEEWLTPGYYSDPVWTVRDVVAHVGTWLAEAENQFERILARTYDGHDIDIDALNASLLDAMSGQPWTVAWVQANAARTKMLQDWYAFEEPSSEAAWWIRKSASDHYAEHLDRLREWAQELVARRGLGERANGGE